MTCDEIAATLEGTLLHQRDPDWDRQALEHAAHCPACSRLVRLHHVEVRLSQLPSVAPSSRFQEAVMDRIADPQSLPSASRRESSLAAPRTAAMIAGAFILATAFLVPSAGSSWLGNVFPSVKIIRPLGLTDYLAHHPPGAVLLAGLATALILLGLPLPERPAREIA